MKAYTAIDLLKGLEQSLDDYCELNDEGKTAFHMAITALELFGNSEQLPSAQAESIAIPIINVAKGFDSIVDEDGNVGFGVYDPNEKQIWVAGDLPQEIFAKSLFHELMHWIQDIIGIPFDEDEANRFSETVYDALSSAQQEIKSPCSDCQEFDCCGCEFKNTERREG